MKYATKRRIENFNQLVDNIERQLDELEAHDPESVVLERWRGYYNKYDPEDKINAAAFNTMYKEAKRFYESGALDIDSIERSIGGAISTIRKEFNIDINRKNFNSFMRFLDDARAKHLSSVYDSEQILTAIAKAKSKGLTAAEIEANIDRWAKKAVKLDSEGKQIEIVNPPELKIRKIRINDKKRQ